MTKLVTFVVSQASVKVSPIGNEKGFFSSITCSAAGTFTVKGIGIMDYIASGASITGHIDPNTGITGVGTAAAAGYFEALPTTPIRIVMVAGNTVNGHFIEVSTDVNFKGWGTALVNHNLINDLY